MTGIAAVGLNVKPVTPATDDPAASAGMFAAALGLAVALPLLRAAPLLPGPLPALRAATSDQPPVGAGEVAAALAPAMSSGVGLAERQWRPVAPTPEPSGDKVLARTSAAGPVQRDQPADAVAWSTVVLPLAAEPIDWVSGPTAVPALPALRAPELAAIIARYCAGVEHSSLVSAPDRSAPSPQLSLLPGLEPFDVSRPEVAHRAAVASPPGDALPRVSPPVVSAAPEPSPWLAPPSDEPPRSERSGVEAAPPDRDGRTQSKA